MLSFAKSENTVTRELQQKKEEFYQHLSTISQYYKRY